MAGRGPAPKDPKLRQRRNKASTRAVAAAPEVSPAAGAAVPAVEGAPPVTPEALSVTRALPTRAEPWHPLTVLWWSAVWDPAKNPFVDQYLETDVLGPLYRLAHLVDRFWWTGEIDVEKEIRLLEQRLVLDPLARRSAQWEVKRPGANAAPPPPPRAPEPAHDPRKVLQMPTKAASS